MRLCFLLACLLLAACHGAGLLPVAETDLGPNYTPAPKESSPGSPARLLSHGTTRLATATRTSGPVDVQLAAERSAIRAGQPLTVGLIIRHDPGYHTYWRFPGVVGLATRIRWNLPPGFRAGPLRWARPQRSVMAGHEVWGYRRDVALLTEIVPPADLPPGRVVEIKADAVWMACANDCNPGFKNFTLRVPVARHSTARPCRALFESMRRETSRPCDAWSFRAQRTATGYRLIATPNDGAIEVRGAYLFNSNALVDSNRPQRFVASADGGFVLELDRWEYAGPAASLRGVLSSDSPLTTTGARFVTILAPF